jgi:hypothetical protein
MGKYEVVIERLIPMSHGFRYQITVYWNRMEGTGDISWSVTRWGARREAKRLIRKHEQPKERLEVVEEYTL